MKQIKMMIVNKRKKEIANHKGEGKDTFSAILDAQDKFLESGFVKYFFDRNYKIKIDFIS